MSVTGSGAAAADDTKIETLEAQAEATASPSRHGIEDIIWAVIENGIVILESEIGTEIGTEIEIETTATGMVDGGVTMIMDLGSDTTREICMMILGQRGDTDRAGLFFLIATGSVSLLLLFFGEPFLFPFPQIHCSFHSFLLV